MSSDETDGEKPKRVRRVALHWRAPKLTELMKAVDSYQDVHSLHLTKQGNQSFSRMFQPTSTASRRAAKPQLPKNFYNSEWLKSLTRAKRDALKLQPMFEIPSLVSDAAQLQKFRLEVFSSARTYTILKGSVPNVQHLARNG